MNSKRVRIVVGLTVILALTPTSALAAPSSGAAHSGRHEETLSILSRVDGSMVTGEDRDRVRAHVDEAMRRSQLVAPSDVEVWSGSLGGKPFKTVVPKGSKVTSASLVTVDGSNDVGQGLAIDESPTVTSAPVAVTHGDSTTGLKPLREACRTIWFAVQKISGTTLSDKVYDCYEKFQLSSTSWIYNRYSNATLTQYSGIRREFKEFTIRFREARGYTRLVGGPFSYGPISGSVDCQNGEFNYGVVKIPIQSCANITNLAGGLYFATGTRYTGHQTVARYLESYARFTSNGSEPIFSDYVWTTIGGCADLLIPCVNTNNDYDNLWTDGLWTRP